MAEKVKNCAEDKTWKWTARSSEAATYSPNQKGNYNFADDWFRLFQRRLLASLSFGAASVPLSKRCYSCSFLLLSLRIRSLTRSWVRGQVVLLNQHRFCGGCWTVKNDPISWLSGVMGLNDSMWENVSLWANLSLVFAWICDDAQRCQLLL